MTRRTKRKKNIGLIIIFISIITLFAFAIASFVYLQKTTAKPVDKIKTSQQIKRNKLSNKEKVEWKKESSPIKLPILMYHAIHTMDPSEAPNANLIVDPKVFEEQVKAMADDGYYFLTPEEAYRVLDKNEKPANKVVWLTFDDSMIDFYQIAYPIMKKYKVKATNNVITSYTDEKRVSNLSLEQMTEMKKNGMSFHKSLIRL